MTTENKATDEVREEYRNLLRSYRISKSRDPIANRHPWNARFAVEELFSFAAGEQKKVFDNGGKDSKEILVLTGSFPIRVYGGAANDILDSFLEKNGRLRVLLWAESVERNNLVYNLKDRERVDIRISGTDVMGDEIRHFLVAANQA